MNKRKAMTSSKARNVRAKGHQDALEFAKSIGLESDYTNNPKAKKDVVDHNGDVHSVKSGTKRWQIFLYSKNRFEKDLAFQTMNGIGQLLIKCLEIYPETYNEYQNHKDFYKENLKIPMRNLQEKMQDKIRLKSFLNKSIFNDGEVDYLTVKHENVFHVFYNKNIIDTLGDNLEVYNSKARKIHDFSDQKVVLKYQGKNLGELEVRNSGANHYREMLFVMNKLKVLELLFEKISFEEKFNQSVWLYGDSQKHFKK